MTQRKFFITGSSGWLGSRLVEYIKLKDTSADITLFEGDICSEEDCKKFLQNVDANSIVVHIAGVIHPRCVRDFYLVNTEGTKRLLRLSAEKEIKRFVHISSNSPIGCNPNTNHLFDELSPYNPYMNYGRSKMLAELEVKKASERGLDTVIIRPPWFYGPNQPARQTLFFKMIQDGKFPIVGNGLNMRSMGYIDNLCQGIYLAALSSQAKGQTYWIADERPYSMNEIVDTVREALIECGFSVKPKTIQVPGLIGDIAYLADKLLQGCGIYHQKIHVLSEMNKSIACSINKAKKELGYNPEIALKEGMVRSIRWCQEQHLI